MERTSAGAALAVQVGGGLLRNQKSGLFQIDVHPPPVLPKRQFRANHRGNRAQKKLSKTLPTRTAASGIKTCLVRGVSKHVDSCETSESRKEGAERAFRKGSTGWSRPVDRSRTASPSHELGPQVCPQ